MMILVADFPSANIYRQIILSFHAIALTSFTEGIYKLGYWPCWHTANSSGKRLCEQCHEFVELPAPSGASTSVQETVMNKKAVVASRHHLWAHAAAITAVCLFT